MEQGWHEDQKKKGQSKKESKTRSLRQGLGCGLVPSQVRAGLVLESGVWPSLYLACIVQLWQWGSGRV